MDTIKEILLYWAKQILEKGLYFLIILAIVGVFFWMIGNSNMSGRYFWIDF